MVVSLAVKSTAGLSSARRQLHVKGWLLTVGRGINRPAAVPETKDDNCCLCATLSTSLLGVTLGRLCRDLGVMAGGPSLTRDGVFTFSHWNLPSRGVSVVKLKFHLEILSTLESRLSLNSFRYLAVSSLLTGPNRHLRTPSLVGVARARAATATDMMRESHKYTKVYKHTHYLLYIQKCIRYSW